MWFFFNIINMSTKNITNKIILSSDKFDDLVEKFLDLSKISDVIKLKIDKEHILMYSIKGSENIVLAFKSYIIDTKEYFVFKDELVTDLNLVITEVSRFVKSLDLIKKDKPIIMETTYKNDDEHSLIRKAIIKNDKLKLQLQTGEKFEIKDLTKVMLKKMLDPKNINWSFSVNLLDFKDIKKLSRINSDENKKIIHINIDNNKVILSETSTWEIEVDSVEYQDKHIMFDKSLLNSINETEVISFNVFNNFILVEDGNCNLMVSFEQDFS
jgi:hypothetical protein